VRSVTTVYRKDGTPIPVVTIENSNLPKDPLPVSIENKVEKDKLIENRSISLGPSIAKSEPDR
jgi:hypothetical protein